VRHAALVVGSGPNGLAAAIELARAGWSVEVREASDRIGGGLRSEALTLPGFLHDVCSAVHPLAASSPFFRSLSLESRGLEWIQPPAPLAHPLDDGTAVLLERSVVETATGLGPDGPGYRRLLEPLLRDWPAIEPAILRPLLRIPRRPLVMARFGLLAIRSARGLAEVAFDGQRARALFAGLSAHSILPLELAGSASFGLVLAILGHEGGWPIPRGGAVRIAHALESLLRSLGGEIRTGAHVETLDELPHVRAILCDVTPSQLLAIAGPRLPQGYRRALARYRYGPAVFKVDWALREPIPWTAADCARAGTVHLGGTLEEIAVSEDAAWRGRVCDRPFVLLAQPSLFDSSRAHAGRHTAWAYCHVPNGSQADMTERIERQIERFAPGFKEVILARHTLSPAQLEERNANLVGGDITGGANDLRQILARPTPRPAPYATPVRGLYLCSASTPPGGGVHGMCGFNAARVALARAR
jgi:phytoene dehydrogenase-like protein